MQMLTLGGFVFSVSEKTPYHGLTRTSGGGFQTVPIFGAKPLSFNTGQPLENIKITCEWYYQEGMQSVDDLRALQNTQQPQLLTDSLGNNLGQWIIKTLSEKQKNLIDDGTALVNQVDIELEEFINNA
jgi:phage protein U